MEKSSVIFCKELETDRLIIRQLMIDDASAVFLLRSNKSMLEYIDRPIAKTLEDALDFILHINKGVESKGWIYWGIFLKEENKLIGAICLWNFSTTEHQAEVGYELHPDFQRKGLMDEAFKAVIAFAERQLKLKKMEAYTHKNNASSINLLEKNNFSFMEEKIESIDDDEKDSNLLRFIKKDL